MDKANAETKTPIERRDHLNEKIKKLRQEISELKSTRDNLNEKVKTLKQQRRRCTHRNQSLHRRNKSVQRKNRRAKKENSPNKPPWTPKRIRWYRMEDPNHAAWHKRGENTNRKRQTTRNSTKHLQENWPAHQENHRNTEKAWTAWNKCRCRTSGVNGNSRKKPRNPRENDNQNKRIKRNQSRSR